MTTSTNTARTRRRPAKAPEDKALAAAGADARDVARTKRKATKPPAGAGPSATPSGATAGRATRKPTKPPAAAGPSTAPSTATAGRATRKPTKPPAAAAPAITAADATAADITAADATAADSTAADATVAAATVSDATALDRAERSVAEPPPEIMSSSGATRLRLVDRIERRAAEPRSDAAPPTGSTIPLAAPAVDAPPPSGVTIPTAPPVVDRAPPTGTTHGRLLGRVQGRVAIEPSAAAPAIGVTATRLFDCPKCARPLAAGTSRCPGCGVRLIMGIPLRRVGVSLAAVVAVAVILVGGITAANMAVGGQAHPTAVANEPTIAPITPTAAPARTIVPAPVGPPAGALAALTGTAVVNGRITVDAATLAATLSRKGATSSEVARALRSLAADAAVGLDLTGRLAPWTDAAPVATQLDDFYRMIAQTARVALRISLADAAGYRRDGAEMLKVLKGLGEVDSASRTLAATVGLELPPLVATD